MSSSQAYANFTNSASQLKSNIDQFQSSASQVVSDKQDFEQQFFIGTAVAAKAKLSEKLVGLFKNSKNIDALKGKTDAQIRKLAQTAKDRAQGVADDLRAKLPGGVAKEPVVNPSASPQNLKQLKDLSDKANNQVEQTSKAVADADQEIIDSRQAVGDAQKSVGTAEDLVESNSARALSLDRAGTIRVADATDRVALNDARTTLDGATQRASVAETSRNDLVDTLTQHQNTASGAAQDLKNAQTATQDVSSSVESDLASGASKVEAIASDSEKALKVAKDGERALKVTEDITKGSASTDEADPLGLVVTAIAGIAATIIGRKLKVHHTQVSGAPPQNISYSSTLGA